MRKNWIDYLRVTAIIAVITAHVTGYYYNKFGEISYLDWWIANIINASSRVAVPIFIAISGVLCLGNQISVTQFYRKRALRLLPAFIFWNIFYYFVTNGFHPVSMINTLIVGGWTEGHLWYLSVFICLMIFVPFINMPFSRQSFTKQDVVLLIAVLLSFTSYQHTAYLINKFKGINIEWFKIFPWYISYFILGYAVNKYGKELKISSIALISALVSIIAFGILMNYYFASEFGIIKTNLFLHNISLIVFISTAIILLLFKKNDVRFKNSNTILAISDASFGIYLIHPLYMKITRSFLSRYELSNITNMFLTFLIVFILSLITINLLRRIKYIRSIC